MKKMLIVIFVVGGIFFGLSTRLSADITEPYYFRVVGHLYPKIDDYFGKSNSTAFTIFTGDVVYDGCNDWPEFLTYTEGIEHYIAPGNHDKMILCPENFANNGYPNYQSFEKGEDVFITLDGNLNHWNIRWAQQYLVEDMLEMEYRNTFIFIHQVSWVADSALSGWLPNSNDGRPTNDDWLTFETQIRPILEQYDNVYIIAGDLGNRVGSYYNKVVNGVTYMGFGLGISVESSYMDFYVNEDGEVFMSRKML